MSPLRGGDDSQDPAPTRIRQGILTLSPSGKLVMKAPSTPQTHDRDQLRLVAKETIDVLPGLLLTRPDAKTDGFLYEKSEVAVLNQKFCPRLTKTAVRVISSDTIDAALQLSRGPADKPICVLNMANAIHAGGGFKSGALAQEEAMCYRTSLFFTLKIRHYPIPDKAAIYSPNVLVIRDSLDRGHKLLDCRDPSQLPVISVVSAAAIYKPSLERTLGSTSTDSQSVYKNSAEKSLMKEKMRVILRVAIRNKHRKIVLGALGCGAFQNPPQQVCSFWADVLQEPEFSGGWWEEVVFAVLGLGPKDKNFSLFHKGLDGLMV